MDRRKCGTCPHGGYGLGTESFVMRLLCEDQVHNVYLHPRYIDRCEWSYRFPEESPPHSALLMHAQKGNPTRQDAHINRPE